MVWRKNIEFFHGYIFFTQMVERGILGINTFYANLWIPKLPGGI
jgi:hypothetical protein